MNRYIHRDKVTFLFTNADSAGNNTSFTIKEPKVYWSGRDDKSYERKHLNFWSNYWNTNTELLPFTTFGTAGTLDPNCNLTPIETYDHNYPLGCSSAVVVNEEDTFTVTLPQEAKDALLANNSTSNKEAILEVWCRYFPDIYTDGTGNQITGDSYDYAKLEVDMVSTAYYTTTLSQRVNTHWKVVQLPIHVSGLWATTSEGCKLKFHANKDLQIARISLTIRQDVDSQSIGM